MTDFLQTQRNSQRRPATDAQWGRQMERALLVKVQTTQWKKSAEAIRAPGLAGYRILTTFCCILDFIHQRSWQGACHASSAVFYVLLKEQGLDPVLCHGMVEKQRGISCYHSWVEVDGKVYDAAISNTLSKDLDSPPVFAGIDLATKQDTEVVYGIRSWRGSDDHMRIMDFNSYMDAVLYHRHGLWGVARDAGRRIGVRLNIGKLRTAYSDTAWIERASQQCGDEASAPPIGQIAAHPSLSPE
jgi:hypothetical protein